MLSASPAASEALARLVGLGKADCESARIAGYLHDLGKLAVPPEVLDKPGRLAIEESRLVRAHAFHTYNVLKSIHDFEVIGEWASYHHERLDGNGYPFHLDEPNIPFGSRIVAVADVFTALSEDRPHRPGIATEQVLQVLENMVGSALDADVVALLKQNIGEVEAIRVNAKLVASQEYERFGSASDFHSR